jgi:hypothetical protein
VIDGRTRVRQRVVGDCRHVQQNQTDLEFLRDRAARIDYELTTDDTTLYFRRRQEASVVAVGCAPEDGPGARLDVFHPRTASAQMASKVIAESGDLSNPVVVGWLWDAAEAPPEASVCGRPPDGR